MLTIAELIALLFSFTLFLLALLRESEGFKLACRLQLVYWPRTVRSRWSALPLFLLARGMFHTPSHGPSCEEKSGSFVKRDKEILRASRRNTRLPLIRTAKGTYIIRPRSPISLGQRFGRYRTEL